MERRKSLTKTREVRDFFGNLLMEGDLIVRSKHSTLCYHKVIRITESSIVVSTWDYQPNEDNPDWSYRKDVTKREDIPNLSKHHKLYLNTRYIKFIIVKE